MTTSALSRGDFIRLSSSLGAGLVLAFNLPGCSTSPKSSTGSANDFVPNAWVRISPNDDITVIVSKSEMGQGVAMGLPTILADELDARFDRVKIEFAPATPQYVDTGNLNVMVTGGSLSIKDGWMPLRNAGAAARTMLIAAAAKQWGVNPSACRALAGSVYHDASNRSATYGSLAEAAKTIPVPRHVALKSPEQFTLIGKRGQRLDIPAKVNGTAEYGIDVRVPGMKYAAIARSPVFGGRVKSFDASKAKAVPGVIDAIQVSNGVAIIAKNTWAAFEGKKALAITWDEGPNASVDTASLFAQAEQLANSHAGERVALLRGNPDTASGRTLEATYRGPFLAHATMEPMNATADVRDGSCDVWAPTQVQTWSQAVAAKVTGLPVERCAIHTTFLGGGFGRRLESDYVREAVEVSKAIKAPVKVQWTREDDIQHDFYRAMSLNVIRGVIDGGKVVALSHQVVMKSLLRRFYPPLLKNGVDFTSLVEVTDVPYVIPNMRVTYIDHEHPIPVGSVRAPNANWNDFVTESFMDELAHLAGKDPLEFRLSLLPRASRAAGVLRLAAEKAGWGQKRPGRAQGIALVFWAESYAAMVAEVSMQDKMPAVHHVVAAIDCGRVVNPDIVVQQGQGATNFGLSAALTGEITISKGRVAQNNFYDYTILRMIDAPAIEIHIVPSNHSPTGVGELCTPPIAPAVGNAIFALTGKRVRQLPFSKALA